MYLADIFKWWNVPCWYLSVQFFSLLLSVSAQFILNHIKRIEPQKMNPRKSTSDFPPRRGWGVHSILEYLPQTPLAILHFIFYILHFTFYSIQEYLPQRPFAEADAGTWSRCALWVGTGQRGLHHSQAGRMPTYF